MFFILIQKQYDDTIVKFAIKRIQYKNINTFNNSAAQSAFAATEIYFAFKKCLLSVKFK